VGLSANHSRKRTTCCIDAGPGMRNAHGNMSLHFTNLASQVRILRGLSLPGRQRANYAAGALYFLLLQLSHGILGRTSPTAWTCWAIWEMQPCIDTPDVVKVHSLVYGELRANIPPGAREHLLGIERGVAADPNNSAHDRSLNPYHAAEFFPCYAIRPLFIEALHLLHRAGLGLVRGLILISTLSYLGLGLLVFMWLKRYVSPIVAALAGLLLMISAPILSLGGHGTRDCLSTLVTFGGLYFLLVTPLLAPGFAFLLASIYIRTDNFLLAVLTIALFWLSHRIKAAHAISLSAVAIVSVWFINHFAGDYGLRMLYYRGFIGTPITPGEMVAQFSLNDYLRAARAGLGLLKGFPLIFLLFGSISLIGCRQRNPIALALLTTLYAGLHFLIFPLPEDRYFGPAYIGIGILAIASAASRVRNVDFELHRWQTEVHLTARRSA
jgi:hypothetical protein